MTSKDEGIKRLAKKLGKKYRVVYIDFWKVIYRDFGNGYNVEIDGVHTSSLKRRATIYLWCGDGNTTPCITVTKVKDVAQDNINAVVEELYQYSEDLIKQGIKTRDDVFFLKNPDFPRRAKS